MAIDPLTIAAGLGAAGSIASSLFGNDASKDAIKLQKKALKQQAAFSNKALGYQEPYREAGEEGLSALLDALGLGDSAAGISRFEASPLYKLLYGDALDDARDDVLSVASSKGMLNSGSTLRGLTDARAKTARGFFGDYVGGLDSVTNRGERAATAAGNIAVGQGTNAVEGAKSLGDLTLARGLGIGNTIGNATGDLASILGMKSMQSRGGSIYGAPRYMGGPSNAGFGN
jgi:hypothetical protein